MRIIIITILQIMVISLNAQYICQEKNYHESLPDCSVTYKTIYNLQNQAYDVLDKKEVSISKRIQLSQEYASKGLALGYDAIQNGVCKEFSIIIDRMLTLSNMLGRYDEGKSLALMRLDIIYPGWKEYGNEVCIDIQHLRDLLPFTYNRDVNSFYNEIRQNDGLIFACGMEDIVSLDEARRLKDHYGNIYCFRYYQNSFLDINPTPAKSYWKEYFDLFISSWTMYLPIDELVSKYENSKIQESGSKFIWVRSAKHFIEIDNTKLFFVPKTINQYKPAEKDNLMYPDPHMTKDTSLFYQRLTWFAEQD